MENIKTAFIRNEKMKEQMKVLKKQEEDKILARAKKIDEMQNRVQ